MYRFQSQTQNYIFFVQPETAQIGTKRPLEPEPVKKTEPAKPDPSKAPDPEEPEAFDDSQVFIESQFQAPEDTSVVTLHRCKFSLEFMNVCV